MDSILQSVRNLTHLHLSHSNLAVKTGNNFPSFPQLYTLELASCNLKEFPSFLTNQSTLRNLDLSYNQIAGHLPDHIWNMSALESLNISHNQLEFLSRKELGKGLRVLDLSFNKLHGSIQPKLICNRTYLSILDLSNNFSSGTLPLCSTQINALYVLNLRKNNIIGTIPDIVSLPSPYAWPSSCQLLTLDLSQNYFQGKIPKSLGGCLDLEVLDLGHNKLHDVFPCWFNKLDRLKVLVLRSKSLYGSIQCLNHNFNWPRLQIVDIASNKFGGNLPSQGLPRWEAMMVDKHSTNEMGDDLPYSEIHINETVFINTVLVTVKGYLQKLTKISNFYTLVDFSDNKFEGHIPPELGELKFLYALNLSHNYLSGQIPSSFGNLYNIESLDLSQNKLNGKIPRQLAALNFLSAFNMSFNHLEGMIPRGRQFQTFSQTSFLGNKGLCGQPLTRSCGNEGVSNPSNSSSKSEAEDDFGNIFIATEIGYALGFGVVMPLLFWSAWRKRYYECIDKVLKCIFCCQPKKSPLPKKTRRIN